MSVPGVGGEARAGPCHENAGPRLQSHVGRGGKSRGLRRLQAGEAAARRTQAGLGPHMVSDGTAGGGGKKGGRGRGGRPHQSYLIK